MKALAVIATCAALSLASTPARAEGGRITAGVLGGIAAGVIIGSAIAPRPYYAPPPAYVEPAPVYVAPGPGPAPDCYWTRGEPMWNGYAWVRPRMQVCD